MTSETAPGAQHAPLPAPLAVPGTTIVFTKPEAFIREFGDQLDRIGRVNGAVLWVVENGTPVSFEQRSLPVEALEQPHNRYRLSDAAVQVITAQGIAIEVSRVAPWFGRPGGALQVRFIKLSAHYSRALTVDSLLHEFGVLSA